ncbi:MAG: DNA replication and repair protein RecF [Candidatus Berkelbacteria bacterium]|nr:DNA replication and repair protein RecF [Candidatus Berkelbacteria bacterium]
MTIDGIKLLNFRNHKEFNADFDRTNIILGPNASGKSNILEAIYLLSTTKSYRMVQNQNLISFEESLSKVEGDVEKEGRKLNLEVILMLDKETKRIKKQARINKKYCSLISLLGNFLAVLFTPETLDIVLGTPSIRRRSLDFILSSVSKKYTKELINFLHILRQRNGLLLRIKEGRTKVSLLDVWDQGFVQASSYIQEQRRIFLKVIGQYLPEKLKLIYLPSPLENLETALKINRAKEIDYGFTLVGPQKDDFIFIWKEKPLVLFGSRGEIREAAVLFKLAEWEFIKEKTGSVPVLLLDDIYSELDKRKRESVEKLLDKGQTILTTTTLSSLSPNTIKRSKIIEIK